MKKSVKRATIVLALSPVLVAPATAALAASTPLSAPAVTSAVRTATTTATTDPSTSGTTAPSTSSSTTSPSTTSTDTTTPGTDAPAGSASAVAAEINGVIAVGKTSATAGSSGGTASAHALELGGQTVSGGDTTNGTKSGSLFATGDTPLGDLELAPWAAKVNHDSTGTQSQAEASLAHAGLLGVLQLWLLHSQSQATWTPAASTGKSSSDGLEVNLDNQLDVKVLHAQTDSSGKGSSAVLVINDQGVITSSDANGSCVIPADPLIHIVCLTAAGGAGKDGTTTAAAGALSATSGSGLPSIDVTGAKSGGAKLETPAAGGSASSGDESGAGSAADHPSSSNEASNLPFTGGEARMLLEAAAAALALGGGLTLAGRRRQTGAA